MNKVNKLGMLFDENNAPNFGSIEANPIVPGEYSLLETDISKLNSALTKTACTPYLNSASEFSVTSGSNAIVVDAPAVWRYHAGTDTWYEIIPEDED